MRIIRDATLNGTAPTTLLLRWSGVSKDVRMSPYDFFAQKLELWPSILWKLLGGLLVQELEPNDRQARHTFGAMITDPDLTEKFCSSDNNPQTIIPYGVL